MLSLITDSTYNLTSGMTRGVKKCRTPRVRLKFIFILLTVFMASCLITFIFFGNIFEFGRRAGYKSKPTSSHRNYFLSQGSYDALEFMVNTSECKILDLDPFDPSIIEHIIKLPLDEVCERNLHWTYVNGTNVVMNETAITESGYNVKDLHCCYRTIHRVEQAADKYDEDADTVVRYSDECIPMQKTTTPIGDHIHVKCRLGYFYEEIGSSVYKQYHIVALPYSQRVQYILKRWKEKEEDEEAERKLSSNQVPDKKLQPVVVERPPNIVIIGMDSTSRLNFRRAMFKTKEFLEGIGAHEMLGYNKVGENTYPNTIPFLTGYWEFDMEDLCRYKKYDKLDECPWLWKNFHDALYLTAEVEDSPRLTSFNYLKTGFVKQPTDYYSRPVMLAAHQAEPGYPYSIDCMGYQTVDEFLLNYMRDLLELSRAQNVPLFLMSWLTQLGHEGMNSIQTGDKYYAKFLKELHDRGLLNNSVLFFMSDHGYRFGPVRNTLSGWYEDKLPNMWIRLPPSIIQKYPDWEDALIFNKRQLSSPYDLYHTFFHILQEFSHTPPPQESPMRNGTTLPRKFGQSLFNRISENRTCPDAGIPDDFCACQYPVKVNIDDPIILQAAGAALNKINKILPPQCIKLTLSVIQGGARLSSSSDTKKPFQYVVDFKTSPGDFTFEGTVQYYPNRNGTFEVIGGVQRLNKINTDVSCIHDPNLELYCFCELILKNNT